MAKHEFTDAELMDFCKAFLDTSKRAIARDAAGYAISMVLDMLVSEHVLDSNYNVIPERRIRVRVLDPSCYIPFEMGTTQ